ncbi:roadblock/LC7 domain-containing protein [Amycolatopsis speibonae]|uniref:Roadblock/LC7 domain-containing protein n=1 Tax=Amycolatopsis speibonae TaxID=1450224 RepID=A0ABV7NSX5_9PSEU
MHHTSSSSLECARRIQEFAQRVIGVEHGIVASADGLLIAASDRLPVDRAERLAAISGGLARLTAGAARCFEAGPVRETVVQMTGGTMVLMPLQSGAHLAVLADCEQDIGSIAYEMTQLGDIVERVLNLAPRPATEGILKGM